VLIQVLQLVFIWRFEKEKAFWILIAKGFCDLKKYLLPEI